ncbi:MAG: asparaginase [Gammaproteobacteria bacterium]|nr:asparaginase [Gammaproteobacteria bacterium]
MTDAVFGHVPLAVLTRGDAIESVHYGSIAVVDADGRVVAACGDPQVLTFTRSSLKPLQALALLAHPRFPDFGLDLGAIAVLCASHSGEPRHVQAVLEVLARAGCHKEQLRCGTHPPFYLEALGQRPLQDDVYTPLQHNCSGKHAGMLALSVLLGAPTESYLAVDHPVQQCIRDAVADMTGVAAAQLACATDGCGAPNYAVPLAVLARGYARLVGGAGDTAIAQAAALACKAIVTHPEMVSGLRRLDLALTHWGQGDWIAKSGAEGVRAFACRSRGLGLAVKIADGAARAREVVSVELLRQLGAIEDIDATPLAWFAHTPVKNCHDEIVGEVRPVFTLREPARR